MLALLKTHGLDVAAWPGEVRSLLWDSAGVSVVGTDAEVYVPHAVHRPGRTYVETNCYTDVLIELLHARGYEPLAMLGINARMDFEGDQWTFFKPAPGDLELLYGIDIHEMQPYRALPDQIAEQLAAGRTMIVELDAWWLPDTAATSYRSEHVKTSVAVDAIDREAGWLRYFHNAGRYELSGEDYRGRVRQRRSRTCRRTRELVRFDAGPALRGDELLRRRARVPGRAPAQAAGDATRSRASARRWRSTLPDAAGGRAAALPRVRVRDGPDGRVAPSSCWPRTCAGCSARTARRSRLRWMRS